MSLDSFASSHYQAHNAARLAHLDSLGLALSGKRVLEVGAGPGDHTGFYLSRGCVMVSTDAREECVRALRSRHPQVMAHIVDMNLPKPRFGEPIGGLFDIVHCYGLLYHLDRPDIAIESMANVCRGMLLLETCVSPGTCADLNPVHEDATDSTQALTGGGCRPTRSWVLIELKRWFPYVYVTRTQPNHPEFPLDWTKPMTNGLTRSVFVASRTPLDEKNLSTDLLDTQSYWRGL